MLKITQRLAAATPEVRRTLDRFTQINHTRTTSAPAHARWVKRAQPTPDSQTEGQTLQNIQTQPTLSGSLTPLPRSSGRSTASINHTRTTSASAHARWIKRAQPTPDSQTEGQTLQNVQTKPTLSGSLTPHPRSGGRSTASINHTRTTSAPAHARWVKRAQPTPDSQTAGQTLQNVQTKTS